MAKKPPKPPKLRPQIKAVPLDGGTVHGPDLDELLINAAASDNRKLVIMGTDPFRNSSGSTPKRRKGAGVIVDDDPFRNSKG
jgi:hypothetical protein